MQTALTYRTNRDLFSNYYLDEHLPETEAWDELSEEELSEAKADIMDLWEREIVGVDRSSTRYPQ